MRILIILLSAYTLTSHANSKNFYANLYADELIKKFDAELEQGVHFTHLFESETYAKIQAARAFLEAQGQINKMGTSNLLEVTNTNIYNAVVNEIDRDAQSLLVLQRKMKFAQNNSPLIYPSPTRSGNVTGNTFPQKVWSLTFDDGPRNNRTQKIVDNLNYYGHKATFFMLMRQVNKHSQALEHVLASDMEIALHSYNHLDLNKASSETMDYEIGEALQELEAKTNQKVRLFRLPYGSGLRNSLLREKITQNKLIHLFWNVDTLDWKDKDPKSIFNRAVKQMQNTPNKSGVILFHDIHAQSVIASEMLMKYLSDNDLSVCSVGEVIDYINQIEQDCLK